MNVNTYLNDVVTANRMAHALFEPCVYRLTKPFFGEKIVLTKGTVTWNAEHEAWDSCMVTGLDSKSDDPSISMNHAALLVANGREFDPPRFFASEYRLRDDTFVGKKLYVFGEKSSWSARMTWECSECKGHRSQEVCDRFTDPFSAMVTLISMAKTQASKAPLVVKDISDTAGIEPNAEIQSREKPSVVYGSRWYGRISGRHVEVIGLFSNGDIEYRTSYGKIKRLSEEAFVEKFTTP